MTEYKICLSLLNTISFVNVNFQNVLSSVLACLVLFFNLLFFKDQDSFLLWVRAYKYRCLKKLGVADPLGLELEVVFGLSGMSSGNQTWIHRRVESTNFVIYLHYFSGHFVYNPSFSNFSNFSPPNFRTFFLGGGPWFYLGSYPLQSVETCSGASLIYQWPNS